MRAEAGDAFGIEAIETACPGAMVCDQACLFQHLEVLRDGRPGDRQLLGDFVDGKRSCGQLLKDGHAGRVGEGIEASL